MGIKQNKLDLASFIVDDFKDFDPAHPDTADALNLGPLFSSGTPRGPRPANPTTTASPTTSPNPTPTPNSPANPGLGPL